MRLDPLVLAMIVAMAALTYLTRIGGFWLAGRISQPERLTSWFRPVPGAMLSAIVAPAVVASGWRGVVAGSLVVLLMVRTGNLLLAAALGIAAIVVLRGSLF